VCVIAFIICKLPFAWNMKWMPNGFDACCLPKWEMGNRKMGKWGNGKTLLTAHTIMAYEI